MTFNCSSTTSTQRWATDMRSSCVSDNPSPVVPQTNAPFTPELTRPEHCFSIMARLTSPEASNGVYGAAIRPFSRKPFIHHLKANYSVIPAALRTDGNVSEAAKLILYLKRTSEEI